MLRQSITAFLYYCQEMLIVLFALSIFLRLNGEPLRLMDGNYSWMLFLFLSGVLPVLFMSKKAKERWFYVHLPIALLFGLLVWEFSIGTLLIITLLPFWRMIHALETPLKTEHIVKRFSWFIGCLVVGYVSIRTMTYQDMDTFMLTYLYIQFALLLLGLLFANFIRVREEAEISLWMWLKNQKLLLYLGLVFSLFVIAGTYIMPFFRFIFTEIPDALVYLLSTPFLDAILGFMLNHEKREFVPQSVEEGPGTSLGIVEEVLAQESMVPAWVNQILLIIVIVAIAGVFLYAVYLIVRNLYMVPGLDSERAAGEKMSIPKTGWQTRSNLWRSRKLTWAQDEIRRSYQSLLVFAKQKGLEIPNHHTARTWSEPYQMDENTRKVWEYITEIYEQKRYSNTPITEMDVESFNQNVKLVKNELYRYDRDRRKELRKINKQERKRET